MKNTLILLQKENKRGRRLIYDKIKTKMLYAITIDIAEELKEKIPYLKSKEDMIEYLENILTKKGEII